MFRPQATRLSHMRTGFELLELIYHSTARALRKNYSNAVLGLVMEVVNAALMVTVFVVMFHILGLRRVAIRGDFILYVMSGVFMFRAHTAAIGAVSGADGQASAMMMHAPMNPIVAVTSAALASLYRQIFSGAIILLFYHTLFEPITIRDPVPALGMVLLAWWTGAAIGLIFYSATPWQPEFFGVASKIYQRVNMIASGKMVVANMTAAPLRALFDWNPLFHIIDQTRGFIFLNYNPHFTSMIYPIKVGMVCVVIGLMIEFFTRGHISASWGKRR